MSTKTLKQPETPAPQEPIVQARTVNDIFFADFPHEFVGCEQIDKYDLRRWLIGYAIMRHWKWTREGESSLVGFLTLGWLCVRVEVVSGGLLLTDGERTELIQTKR